MTDPITPEPTLPGPTTPEQTTPHPTLSRAARRSRRAALLAAALAAAALPLLPTTAEAHVRVTPDNPTSGGFSALTFRVPNESATAGTVELSVALPTDTPFLYVSTKPVPGWTATTTTTKLPKPVESYGTTLIESVSKVTWTAGDDVRIGPGEYQEFSISVGPLPAPGTVLLPATQTYSDGTVVRWDEPTPASGEEPEHPAPALAVVATAADGDAHGGAHGAEDDPSTAATTTAATAPADPVARALAGAGLAAGLVGLGLGGLALRRGTDRSRS